MLWVEDWLRRKERWSLRTFHNKVKSLSDSTQKEVLDFVDYLLYKSRQEDVLWSKLSLTSAIKGLEDEEWPECDR